MSWLRRLTKMVVALAAIVLLLALWLLETESGARFVLDRALGAAGGKVTVAAVRGSLDGTLVLTDVRVRDPAFDVTLPTVRVVAAPWHFFLGRALLREVVVEHARGVTHPGPQPAATPAPAVDAGSAPLPIVIERLALIDARWEDETGKPAQVDTLELGVSWIGTRVTVRQLRLRVPEGTVALDGDCDAASFLCAQVNGGFDLQVEGRRLAGKLKSSGDKVGTTRAELTLTAPAALQLSATLAPGASRAWTAHLVVPTFDPRPLTGVAQVSDLALKLEAEGDRSGGSISGDITLNGHALTITGVRYAQATRLLTLDDFSLRSRAGPGELTASGTVSLASDAPQVDLELDWRDVTLPRELVGQSLDSTGQLTLAGSPDRYRVDGALTLGGNGHMAQMRVAASGEPERVTIDSLTVKQARGELRASGEIALVPELAATMRIDAQRFDPSDWLPEWPGAIDLAATLTGTRTTDGISASMALERLGGTLRGLPLRGSGQLALAPPMTLSGDVELASGRNVLRLAGTGGAEPRVTAALEFANLAELAPELHGQVHGTLASVGTWPHVSLNGELRAQELDTPFLRVGKAQVTLALTDLMQPAGRAAATLSDVEREALHFDSVALRFDGDAARHALTLEAAGKPADLRVLLEGGRVDDAWRGQLAALTLTEHGQPPWTLEHPVNVTLDARGTDLSDFCLRQGAGHLCLDLAWRKDTESSLRYRIADVPLSWLGALAGAPADLRLSGALGGSGNLTLAPGGEPLGDARFEIAEVVIEQGTGAEPVRMTFAPVRAQARLAPDGQHLELKATVQGGGEVDATALIAAQTRALSGRVHVALTDVGILRATSPSVASLHGAMASELTLSGSVAAPQVAGDVRLTELRAELPGAGITLSDGSLQLTLANAGDVRVEGKVTSGAGTVRLAGTGGLDAASVLSARIDGSDFTLMDLPSARVIVAPALTLTRDKNGYHLTGEVGIPNARVDAEHLPGGTTAQRSADVIVVDRPAAAPAADAMPFDAEVAVVLGKDVKLTGYGLDGSVSGRLTVIDRPGRVTTGRGSVSIEGSYQAYGQKLAIERGRLLFAGTALDDPGLDLRAVRTIGDIKAGVAVSGRASAPVLNVYSTPAMAQSEALSYLVTGQPLNTLRGSEGAMVNNAARAMGTAAGNRLAQSVGAKIGIDAGVSDSVLLGGAAFTVGKYLSPKLFVSYGVGLFIPGDIVTLRYLLSKRWNIEIENASRASRTGVNYQIEKD